MGVKYQAIRNIHRKRRLVSIERSFGKRIDRCPLCQRLMAWLVHHPKPSVCHHCEGSES